jgi:very-short-patch-repair endonuclease
MTRADPSPAPSGHPPPQEGGREEETKISRLRPLTEIAKEQQLRRKNLPSPLAGEGVSRRLTGEGFAKLQAKRLRHEMTEAETKLWHQLRAKRFEDYKFRRQVAIGRYIMDFGCHAEKVIVEVDGSQHEASEHDAVRDAWLQGQGFPCCQALEQLRVAKCGWGFVDALGCAQKPLSRLARARHPPPQGGREGRKTSLSLYGRGCPEGTGEGVPKGRERDVKND